MEWELLIILWIVKPFRHMIHGRKFNLNYSPKALNLFFFQLRKQAVDWMSKMNTEAKKVDYQICTISISTIHKWNAMHFTAFRISNPKEIPIFATKIFAFGNSDIKRTDTADKEKQTVKEAYYRKRRNLQWWNKRRMSQLYSTGPEQIFNILFKNWIYQ